ncbi:sarcosine oxidase subunit gamma [Salinarimonas chemoclinalis]|uniref:sarcosine oxidase subunit gamma n=1 Tax=Salinarimonas chemoclinalis TaxID=3241599 RepID=UPI0035585EE7
MLESRNRATRVAPFPLATETIGRVAIAPLPPRTRLSLRLRPAAAADVGAVAGLSLDMPITATRAADGRRALRLGPDEWLLLADADEAEELTALVTAGLAGTFHALVDVSHRSCGLAVTGAGAGAALNAGCPLDLSPKAFPIGTATRTVLAKTEILLARLDADAFEVECWRSWADYLRGFLLEAARGL